MKMMEALLNAETENAKQTRDEFSGIMPDEIKRLSDASMKSEDALNSYVAICRCAQMKHESKPGQACLEKWATACRKMSGVEVSKTLAEMMPCASRRPRPSNPTLFASKSPVDVDTGLATDEAIPLVPLHEWAKKTSSHAPAL